MNRRWSLFLRAAIISSIGVALFTLTRRDTPESAYAEGAVAIAREYIMAKEGWSPDAYMVKDTSTRDRAGNLIVNVIHKDDLKPPTVGGGKSVQLHIDMEGQRVVKILHFQ